MNKIIFGGAFDPIHNGHINMAKNAMKALNGEVLFVPARISVWKEDSAPIDQGKVAAIKDDLLKKVSEKWPEVDAVGFVHLFDALEIETVRSRSRPSARTCLKRASASTAAPSTRSVRSPRRSGFSRACTARRSSRAARRSRSRRSRSARRRTRRSSIPSPAATSPSASCLHLDHRLRSGLAANRINKESFDEPSAVRYC